MPNRPQLSAWTAPVLRHTAVRTGLYEGVGLSTIFVAWIFVANRLPAAQSFALERNLVTLALLAVVALYPVARFLRDPSRLWAASLLGWAIFSLTYGLMAFFHEGLREHFGGFQVFVLGAIANMILATVDWLGNIVWRVWSAAHSENGQHPVN
jgi:hypothetical protein